MQAVPMSDPLTAERLEELERLARQATSGKWRAGRPSGRCLLQHEHGHGRCDYRLTDYVGDVGVAVEVERGRPCAEALVVVQGTDEEGECASAADSAYIAAADPATVLALIARIRELENRE
jgi:hypothetical protein